MIHHTKDKAQRAEDIANRKADEYVKQTGRIDNYNEKWQEFYAQALRELAGK